MTCTRINPEYQPKGAYLEYLGACTGDFNNLDTTGFYYNNNGMTANKPVSGGMWGPVVVLGFQGVYVAQVVFNLGSLYWRAKYGSPQSWSTWKTLTS